MKNKLPLLLATSMFAGFFQSAQAVAEEAANASSDIIVTGLKDEEGQAKVTGSGALGDKTLLDTPFSVTVVDAEEISKRQATTIAQIFVNDPAVFSYAPAGSTNWWGTQIRGLGVRNMYIDDVQLMLYWGGDYALESIESVEALKGLTGFMHGFGAPGGLLNYRTKRPTEEALLTTEIGWRSKSDFYGHVDAGGPLTQDGKLGYRINIAGEKGTLYNDAKNSRWLGSLALEYAFSPSLKWYATGTFEDNDRKAEPFHVYWDEFFYHETVLPKPTYDYDNLNIDNSFYKTRTLATATGLDWQIAENWSAKLTYGYNSKLHHANKMFVYMLNSAGDYDGNTYNFGWLDKTHFAQAMIQGSFETGPVRHSIVAGASYILNKSYRSTQFDWDAEFVGNIYEDQTFLVTKDISFALAPGHDEEQQRALFLSDTLYVGEHLQAIVGARYTRYKVPVRADQGPDSGYKTSALTPTFALIVKPAPYATIYASYVESLEPGSRVGGEYANFGELLKATVSKQYEVGVKYEHQGLSLTAAAFRIERANTMDRYVDGARYLTQDGLSLYKGIEATGSYRVTEDLRLGLGAIYLDPALSKLSPGNEELIGNVPMEAAKWQVTGNFDYYVSAVPGLSIHGNARYFGKAPVSDFNVLYIPDRVLANAGFQYETVVGGQKVAFTGNLNNLFNKKYWGLGNIGEGRNASFSVKVYW